MVPAPLLIQRPLLNGHEFSHTSLEILIEGLPLIGVKSMNYSAKKEVGKVYGTAPQKLGRTRGKEDPTCDMEIYRIEWEVVKQRLGVNGQGFMERPVLIQVTIAEPGMPILVDQIWSAEVTEASFSSSDGTDPLVVKLTFDVMRILSNGAAPSLPLNIGF